MKTLALLLFFALSLSAQYLPTVFNKGGSSGALSCTVSTAATRASLTTLGPTNWAYWTSASITPGTTMSGGTGTISATLSAGTITGYSGDPQTFDWTNGTPTGTGSNISDGIYANPASGFHWTLTVPAGTASHTVRFWVGLYSVTGITATIHLSDSSHADYTDTEGNASAVTDVLYTCTYNAASAGQTLTLTWTRPSTGGNLDIQAVAYN